MARLLLGVSGGIAAYKALEFVRLATARGHVVRVVQTPASTRFVGEASFAALTGAPVLTSEFQPDPARGAFPGDPLPDREPASHLALVHNADAMLVAPASANTLAKLAHGQADNLLTSAALAARCPLLVAPAMNDAMYEHAATQANLALLRERGVRIVEPTVGRLATHGEWGVGRLAEPSDLLAAVEDVCTPATWAGITVLVTAGGTREPIDDVRFVGNRSSGRQGVAVAAAAVARGASVVLIAANVELPRVPGVRYVDVRTAAELEEACVAEFSSADVLVMTAAVADFRPTTAHEGKLSKAGRTEMHLELEATADILARLSAARRDGQKVIGFAAEHGDGGLQRARAKLTAKGLDAIVLNDVSDPSIGFDSPLNAVTILTGAGADEQRVGPAPKRDVADAVLDAIERLRV